MPRVGVVFELLRCDTRPGETVCVRGSPSRLGSWQLLSDDELRSALTLVTEPKTYPRWVSKSPLWLESEDCDCAEVTCGSNGSFTFEYKYLKDKHAFVEDIADRPDAFTWEVSENRSVTLPCVDGAVYVISDACWNAPGQRVALRRDVVRKQRTVSSKDSGDTPPTKLSYILSPRRQGVDDKYEFPIEREFNALDSPSKSVDFQLEGLRQENDLLRRRLKALEKESRMQQESRRYTPAASQSEPEEVPESPEVTPLADTTCE
eukprot:gb/GFBE01049226.1/.p1 GENE.gb/GFBE01049226.1/~~gb/GFBE01049226.1/.p1  ORF type:complete len:262 (+),score=55.55 gb/GFBE01049226.1/:1-786(+)